MIKKISLRVPKPRATFLNKLLSVKSTKSGRMGDKRNKRLQSKIHQEMKNEDLDSSL